MSTIIKTETPDGYRCTFAPVAASPNCPTGGFRALFDDGSGRGGLIAAPTLTWRRGDCITITTEADRTLVDAKQSVQPRPKRWPKLRRVTLVSAHGGPFVVVPSRADAAADRRAGSALARMARRAARRTRRAR